MAISTNQKPTIYRNLYENTAPVEQREMRNQRKPCIKLIVD